MLGKIDGLLDRQDTLEKKLFWGLSLLLTAVCVVTFVMTLVEYLTQNLNLTALVMSGLCILPAPLIMFICYKTQAYDECYMAMVIVMGAILLPITFFANGGLLSGMPIFCVGGVFMCGFCMKRSYRLIACIVSVLSCVISFLVSRTFPQLVYQIDNRSFIEWDIILSFVIIATTTIVTVVMVINEYQDAIVREGQEAERKAEMRLELMNIQLENVADLKRIRHDERHHNALILEYAENKDIEGLKRYIKQKMYTDEYYATKIYCMNAVINNVLTVYTRKAQKENITVNVNADVVNNLNISEPDLVSILANVFENAIHGTREVPEGNKVIDVDVHSKGSRLIMKVSNTCRPDLQLYNGYPAKRPGTGINSITRAANNYDGSISYKLDDGMLTCTVILLIPD